MILVVMFLDVCNWKWRRSWRGTKSDGKIVKDD